MATCIFAIFALVTLVANIREIGSAETQTIKVLANMTPEELVYILQTRNGVNAVKPKSMTPCARAILGCCNDKQMNEHCSERLQCGAYFFDDNPCEDKFLVDALNAANYFYHQFDKVKT